MKKNKGLLIVHLDGVGFSLLQKAITEGKVPFIKNLIEKENYRLQRYSCGIPSTTPYVQAGILYGNNTNIPGFRWWDKSTNQPVFYGPNSSFEKLVAKHFSKLSNPLIRGGAAIATCYVSGAKDTFGLMYRQRVKTKAARRSEHKIIFGGIVNPRYLYRWIKGIVIHSISLNIQSLKGLFSGKRVSRRYVSGQILQEIFLHYLSLFAVWRAMKKGFPIIYAAFYAYDETAHAFGPKDSYAVDTLSRLDDTLAEIASKRTDSKSSTAYELVVLSDHGQIETVPFKQRNKIHFSKVIEEFAPGLKVFEVHDDYIDYNENADIMLDYSGGLAHLYFLKHSGKLTYKQIQQKFPGFIEKLLQIGDIEFLLVREGRDVLVKTKNLEFFLSKKKLDLTAREFLSKIDDPSLLIKQLIKLSSHSNGGDIIMVGKLLKNDLQVNFEDQIGGHGSVGGEQTHPFILLKKDWGINTSKITDSTQLYPILIKLRDKVTREF